MNRLADWARQLRAGQAGPPPPSFDPALFGPLASEVRDLARSLARARVAIAEEARLRLRGEAVWTEERLTQFARARLGERPLVVVSNREPVSHVRRGRTIVPLTPASGVVTAMEPIMRACGGVWVAHGSGDADREVVDERGMVRLPPDAPRYALKRIWLSEEEETGYYYGFANEGLWPLCHIVHARPIFRPEDWRQYEAVNAKFADAVLEVIAETDDPAVLIQDYHFALLPRLIKEKRPDAHVALFWHIPWPNAEAFGICPWQTEILDGMLGADLIGFHTQFHCNNFLETVDRVVEARIDWEHFSVARSQRVTLVKPFPISVAPRFIDEPPATSRAALLQELGIDVEFLGVGVERIDYTKGLPERFAAIRRFFTQHPEYRGRLTFVQLAAPSRSRITRYRSLEEELDQLAGQINGELGERKLAADRSPQGPPRPPRRLALLPLGGLRDGDLAPRRHEPGRQGVRVRPGRRRRRADPEPVHRRRPGAAGRHAGQPLRRRRDGRGHPRRHRDARPASGGAAWRGCARPCASTTSTAGPVSCSASSRGCPASPISPTDPASEPGPPRNAVRLRSGFDPALRQLLRNAGWLLLSDGTVLVAGLLGTLVAARVLGAQEFGRLTLVSSVIGVAHLLVDVRAWEAVTRYLSEFTSRHQPALALATLKLAVLAEGAVAVLGFGLVWLASGVVATRLFKDPSLRPLILLAAGTLVVTAFDRTARAVLRVFDRFGALGLCSAIEAVLSFVLVVAAVTAGARAKGVLVAHLVGRRRRGCPAPVGRRARGPRQALGRAGVRPPLRRQPLPARDARFRRSQRRPGNAQGADAALRSHPARTLPLAGGGRRRTARHCGWRRSWRRSATRSTSPPFPSWRERGSRRATSSSGSCA